MSRNAWSGPLAAFCLLVAPSCSSPAGEPPDAAIGSDAAAKPDAAAPADAGSPDAGAGRSLVLHYSFGTYSGSPKNLYVVWAENAAEGYYQPFAVCERLLDGSLTGSDVLPYWHLNAYPEMSAADVDAVTGATQSLQDLSFTLDVAPDAPASFSLYFETDVSFNANDWFTDQPAILYRADIDYADLQPGYALAFVGWTPHSTILDQSRTATGNDALAAGEIQSETRYITNTADDTAADGFGGPDDAPQTNLIGDLSVTPQ